MRRWIKWFAIDWINSTARDELTPEERATFLDFVCLSAFPGSTPGTFRFASWEGLSRKLNTSLPVIISTKDKCLNNRISVANSSEGIIISILNWQKYQAVIKSDLPDNKKTQHPLKSDNKTAPQRRGRSEREKKKRKEDVPAFEVPEEFMPLTKLPGYKVRNHTRAFANIKDACADACVDVAEVIRGFASEYNVLRHTYAWVDPVAALKGKPLAIAIRRVLEAERHGSTQRHPIPPSEDPQAPDIPGPFAKYV